MYFPEPYCGYTPQGHFYHSNMIAQQGHAFLAERPFNSPPPCFYSNHQQHPFPERTVGSQAASTQNSYQPYNLPQSHVQRRQAVREEPAITTQELSPRVANSLPVYFRVKPSFTNHNGRRCRKSRTVFTELQLRILEKTFSEHKYLDTTHRSKIAHTLSLNETQVKTWFQNRRMKWKRESPDNATTVERAKRKDCDSRKANDQGNHITLMASY